MLPLATETPRCPPVKSVTGTRGTDALPRSPPPRWTTERTGWTSRWKGACLRYSSEAQGSLVTGFYCTHETIESRIVVWHELPHFRKPSRNCLNSTTSNASNCAKIERRVKRPFMTCYTDGLGLGSGLKPYGYIALCRSFQIQIPILTANYRNGIGV